jgi:serine/threonine-protein kinase
MAPERAVGILEQVAAALQATHARSIVHRDLKPENVFLVKNEDEEVAKVLDFGVAKVEQHALSEGTRTRTGSILGTPYYMSPEQAQGNRTVDARSDLWSIAVIAFECLTGRRPFFSDGLGDLVLAICVRDIPVPSELASVPIGFDAWWNRAVARDPEKRFQTARELNEALRDALGLEKADLPRESPRGAPDIEVTSAPDTDREASPETPVTDPVPGMKSGIISGAVTIKADDAVEPNAPTVVAPAPDLPALTERHFSTTQKSPPSTPVRSSDGTGLVIGVAAGALFVGLIAGVLFLRSRNQVPDQHRALPAPLPAAVARKPSEPQVNKPKAPLPSASAASSAEKPLLEFLPGDSSAPPASAAPAPEAPPQTKPETPAAPTPSADAPWVKPSWAIPDGEPVRRQPIDE